MLRNELYTPWFNNSDWGFEVIDGEFSGVVVQVAELELKEETEEDPSNLLANYHVISKPQIITDEQLKSDLFSALFQTIITDIVKEAIESYDQTTSNE